MLGSLGRLIARTRRTLRLKSAQLATLLGVANSCLSMWESGTRPVPKARLQDIANSLQLPVDRVEAMWTPADVAPIDKVRWQKMPPYPIRYSLSDVPPRLRLALTLTPAEWDELEHAFPRDRPEELTVAIQLLRAHGRLRLLAPVDLGCSLLVVKHWTEAYAGHLLTHAIVVRGQDRELIALPQVSLISVSQSCEYRVDYLILWRGKGVKVWAYLEIFGGAHDDQVRRDQRRVRGIKIRRIVFEAEEVEREDFLSRLVAALRRLEVKPLPFSRSRGRS